MIIVEDNLFLAKNQNSQAKLLFDLQWFASAEEEGRTEEPSEHKLKKAREEGRVAKSTEINGALVLLLPVIAIIILAPWIFKSCVEVIRFYFDRCVSAELTDSALVDAFYNYFIKRTFFMEFVHVAFVHHIRQSF